MLPSTIAVDGRSTIEEWGLPLKSTETSSSSVASRIPRSLPAAASRKASLIACTVAGFPTSTVRSTTDTFTVGTRMAMPSSLPLRCGSTSPTARAAPVVVGIMLTAAARARRRSLWGKSWIFWSFVYACTVEAKPRLMPNASSSTLAVVARQFVVQDAFDTMRCLAGSYIFSLTPSTSVTSGSLAGAVMMTFLAPAWMCLEAVAVSTNRPVDSTTTSTPSSFQGRLPGALSASTRTSRPLTKIAPSLGATSAGRLPWTESCLSRWASVLASARSFTPTTSMSGASSAARKNTRPMRPKPLTPTRMLMEGLLVGRRGSVQPESCEVASVYGDLAYPSNCEDPDPRRPRRPQRAGARRRGGAGGEHVIHHDHVAAGRRRRGREGAADVGAALGGAEVALWRRGPHPAQPARPHRHVEAGRQRVRQQRGLVEAALVLAGARQWHRDQPRHVAADRAPPLRQHQRGQRPRQGALALELEGVDCVANHTGVLGAGTGPVPVGRLGGAGSADAETAAGKRHPARLAA